LNPTSFSPIFIIYHGVRIDVSPWLSSLIAWFLMPMLARVVALLIVKGDGVGSDGEECDVIVTQRKLKGICFQFTFNLLSL
jgi:hypothetical protein